MGPHSNCNSDVDRHPVAKSGWEFLCMAQAFKHSMFQRDQAYKKKRGSPNRSRPSASPDLMKAVAEGFGKLRRSDGQAGR